MEKSKLHRIDYLTLIDLARSLNIKFVEARGLDTRRGIRFCKGGSEWIAVDRDLPVNEKIRTLGFLLEKRPAEVAKAVGMKRVLDETGPMTFIHTLCC